MTSLKEFLEDTQIAIDNGFGKKETILRMFNALYATMELHQPIWTFVAGTDKSVPLCLQCREGGSEADYPCQTIQTIEKELQ